MKKILVFFALLLTSDLIWAQSVDYQQRFKDAIAQLESCQECAVQQLLEIRSAQYAPETVRINSNIALANISVSVGNIEALDVMLKDIEQYIAQHPDNKDVSKTLERLKGYRSELEKQEESFRDRLIGTWVTAEAGHFGWYYKYTPVQVLEIQKSDNGELTATYYPWGSKVDKPKETDNIDIEGSQKLIGIHFGTEKYEKADTEYAQALMNQVRQNASESAATKARTGYSDWGKDMSNVFMTLMAKNATVSKSTYVLIDYFLKELAPNILYGRYYYEYREDRSDGKNTNFQKVRDRYLYRITPDDSIFFATPHNIYYWLSRLNNHFRDIKDINKSLSKGEKISLKEYNSKAYSQLRNKIMKETENLETVNAEWVTNELIYGPKGYSWNDGYYYANEGDAIKGIRSYNENFKGPYRTVNKMVNIFKRQVDDDWTIHDYWKRFKREDKFKEDFNYEDKFYGSGIPKLFKMVSDKENRK